MGNRLLFHVDYSVVCCQGFDFVKSTVKALYMEHQVFGQLYDVVLHLRFGLSMTLVTLVLVVKLNFL